MRSGLRERYTAAEAEIKVWQLVAALEAPLFHGCAGR